MSAHPLLQRSTRYWNDYGLILWPGTVRYISPKELLNADLPPLIAAVRKLSTGPQLSCPRQIFPTDLTETGGGHGFYPMIEGDQIDALFPSEPWNSRLSFQQQCCRALAQQRMDWRVYAAFQEGLHLTCMRLDECLAAWVAEAQEDSNVLESYRSSNDHLILDGRMICVFRKTAFVAQRLEELADLASCTRSAVSAEALKKSAFASFIYIMEDLRNHSFKIGRSKTPAKRERTLQSEAPQIVLRFSIPAEESDEKWLHQHFAEKNLRGEWFALSPEEIVFVVNFLKSRGDTQRASIDHQWLGETFFRAAPQ